MAIKLTKHERHARLVKIVRRTYQADNPGSRLFPNTSGVAWRGNASTSYSNLVRVIELFNPRPIYFGIPEPERSKNAPTKSGGTDLLGETKIECLIDDPNDTDPAWVNVHHKILPVLTGIECKSGKGKLKKNQKIFRDWMKKINAIWYKAVECPCQENWIPVYRASKIIYWEIPVCENCNSKGFTLEDE